MILGLLRAFRSKRRCKSGIAFHCAGRMSEAIERLDEAIEFNPENATAYFYRGTCHAESDNHREATMDFTMAIALRPDLAEAYCRRGRSFRYLGKNVKAAEDFDRVAEFDLAVEFEAEDAEAYYQRALRSYENGEYEKVVADLDKAIAIRPDHERTHYLRGVVNRKSGNQIRAAEDFDRASELDTLIEFEAEDAEAYYQRAIRSIENRKYVKAVADLHRAIEIRPDHARTYHLRGVCRGKIGDYIGATSDYEWATNLDQDIELAAEDAEPFLSRGKSHAEAGQHRKALRDYDRTIELRPGLAAAYCFRGYSYAALGDYRRAIEDFDKAIGLNPRDAVAYYNRGVAFLILEQYVNAVVNLNKAIALKPIFAVAYLDRGVAHMRLGKHGNALADFGKAIAIEPENCPSHYFRGVSCRTVGALLQAAAYYDRALMLNSGIELARKDAIVYYCRGNESMRLGRYQEAIMDFGMAIKLGPNLAAYSYLLLGACYKKAKDFGEAAKKYDKAIKLNPELRLSPEDAIVYHYRGDHCMRLGQFQRAVTDFSTAIELDSRLLAAYLLRGVSLNNLRRFWDAKSDFDKVIALRPEGATGHYVSAFVHWQQREHREFDIELEKFLELQPSYIFASNTPGSYRRANEYRRVCKEAIINLEPIPPPSMFAQSRPIQARSKSR